MTPDLKVNPATISQQRYEKHGANTSAKQEHRHLQHYSRTWTCRILGC